MEPLVKRLVLGIIVILGLVTIASVGCADKESGLTPEDGEALVSSCVACHTDKDLLKEVATSEPEEEKSEATSGEG